MVNNSAVSIYGSGSALQNFANIKGFMLPFRLFLPLIVLVVTILGCTKPYKYPYTLDFPGAYIHPIRTPPAVDGRERFREIFCQLLADDPEYHNEAGNCEDFLLRLSDESPLDKNPDPVSLPDTRYRILVVPGLFNECFASIALPFEASIETLRDRGFRIDQLVVSGRSSSDGNAAQIAEVIENKYLSVFMADRTSNYANTWSNENGISITEHSRTISVSFQPFDSAQGREPVERPF